MKITPFVEYLLEDAFRELEGVEVKRMFGGYAFYLDDRIFGITISDDQLAFKWKEEEKEKFEDLGGERFIYTGYKKKGPVAMPYWTVPSEILENSKELAEWARESAKRSTR